MREAIFEKRLGDMDAVTIHADLSEQERYADFDRQLKGHPHDFTCEGILVHESFDPDGPEFVDCVVRIFD